MTTSPLPHDFSARTWRMWVCPTHPDYPKMNNWCEACRGYVGVAVELHAVPSPGVRAEDERAELETLRDLHARLAFVDDADQPIYKPWIDAHKLHADEPYIGCPFCRGRFVDAEALDRALRERDELDAFYQRNTAGILTMAQTFKRERDEAREALDRIARGDVPGEGDWADCVQVFARGAAGSEEENRGD